MNTELLKKIKKYIKRYPERLDMKYIVQTPLGSNDYVESWKQLQGVNGITSENACGTVACIAGWAIALSDKRVSKTSHYLDSAHVDFNLLEGARIALGLDDLESRSLFDPDAWPAQFRERYNYSHGLECKANPKCPGCKKNVKVTCERIDHFIRVGV
jgi:hypothetical protein